MRLLDPRSRAAAATRHAGRPRRRAVSPAHLLPAALLRLRKYTGREPGYEPITKLAQARTAERFETAGLTGPWTVEVEQALQNQPRFVVGIRDLFRKSGLTGWEKDLKVLESQLDAHAKWLRTELLPRARTTNRLPPEIYADKGVQLHPYPKDVMLAARRATFELYEAEAKTNPDFAAIYRPWKQFRDTEFQWFKVAEATYSNFNY